MAVRIATIACALVLATTAAWAQPSTPSLDEGGRIARIDENAHVIVLDNGRMYRVMPSSVIYVDNQPVRQWTTLQPGQTIIIRSGQPVVYQNGQYIEVRRPGTAVSATEASPSGTAAPAITAAPGTTVVTPPPPAPSTTVIAPAPAPSTTVIAPAPAPAPGSTVVAPAPGPSTVVVNPAPAAPAAMKRTIYGTVTDVDRGEIKIKTSDDKFEMKMPRELTSQLKKGDNVQLDVTFTPSSPSAFPRR